ncbi:hypothetical protein ACQ4PT_029533 [Festuca glaucescens]
MEKTRSDEDSWGSGLPCDLARCIGDRLDDLARICFRAVCRSWRAALPVGRVTSIPSPLLVIPATPRHFLSLPFVRSVVADSSALALHIVADSKLRCVGSSGGWLAVADSDSVIWLMNPMTRQEAACLPPLPRSVEVSPWRSRHQFNHDIRDHGHTIHKVAFSVKPLRDARGSSYVHSAAALHRATGRGCGLALSFTRAGWNHWMWRQPTNHRPFGEDGHFDVAYCQGSGVYYVVTPPGLVCVLDMSTPVPTLEPLVTLHPPLRYPTFAERRHLVVLSDNDGDCNGDGVVWQMYLVIIKDDEREQQRVVVHKYTAEAPWSVGVVSNLRGRALLISSHGQSVLVLPTASSLPWLRADCVYWLTDHEYDHGPGTEKETFPVWRFHVPTNTTDRFVRRQAQLGAEFSMMDWGNSLWLTPSLT